MFIDQAKITVKAGDGGSGIVSFMKGKLHPRGIPDGGDGGGGGNIVFEVDGGLNTLQQYKYQPYFKVKNGSRGGSNRKSGKNGDDMVLKVPPGTLIKDEKEQVLFDLKYLNQHFVAAKGGMGGHGNAYFTNAKYKAPRFAEKGEPGDDVSLKLELKVLADVGIIGFPNTGKSTLISVISGAKPKIADYPFTTLTPNLGVVTTRDGYSYVVADIPGLIKGAHKGKGLGDAFLKHVERAGILLHLIDASSQDPVADFETLEDELKLYGSELSDKHLIAVLNKIDTAKADIDTVKAYFKAKGILFFAISALKKEGTAELADFVGSEVKKISKPVPEKEEVVYRLPKEQRIGDFTIEEQGHHFIIKGEVIERLVKMLDLENEEALEYLHRRLRKAELDERLEKAGVEEGDSVEIAGYQFDFTKSLTE